MSEVTIVIPVYNEGENIGECLRQIHSQVKVPYCSLVVYDFDEDNSIPVVLQLQQESPEIPVKLLKNNLGRGVINAIKMGLKAAESSYVVVTMADLSDPPSVINHMMDVAKSENSDIVCGSRYMKGGKQYGGPLLKKVLSRVAGVSLYFMTSLPTHDVTNSFKLYKKTVLDAFTIESEGGFEIGMELVVKAHFNGFKVSEVPTEWTDRIAGESNFKLFKWLPNYLKWYFYSLKKNWM